MNIRSQMGPIEDIDVGALAIPVFENETTENTPLLETLHERTGGAIGELLSANELRGKLGETTYLFRPSGVRAGRLVFVGGGKPGGHIGLAIRRTAAVAARFLRSKNINRMGYLCRPEWESALGAQAATEGVLLGLFDVDTYKTRDKEGRFLEDIVIVAEEGSAGSLEQGVVRGKILGKATNYARNLVNEPASVLTPTELAARATELASRYNLDIEVLDESRMRELNMGAMLAVARGSDEPAKLIVIRYTPEPGQRAVGGPLAFVGKGVTFDSGGISLKPSEGMERMKYDMSGGAAVLGAMRAIGQLRPGISVIGIVPATENMPSGRAQKPGDVIRSMSGITIEVINTDAEGRLILADAITYAQHLGATRVVDLATLTGSSVIALGSVYAAIMGSDEELVKDVIAAGQEAGELLWQLPLDDAFRSQIMSDIADLKNLGGRKAGAITAAQFLKEFAGGVPWAHLDIAGTALLEEKKPYLSKGPTGMGVRTLAHLAERLARSD